MRKLFWRLHSTIGLIAGLGLVLIGLTGSILVFNEEIDGVFRAGQTRAQPHPEGRLPLNVLVQSVESALPGYAVTGWAFNRDNPKAADGVFVMPFGTREWHYATINPYTGKLLSGPVLYSQTFKSWILDLHYTFFLHDLGMAITGILGCALLFLGISGLWLYRRFWRSFFRLRWRASARILFGDIHRFVGVTSVIFNLVIGFTGAYWNLTHVIEDLIHPHMDPADEVLFYEKLFSSNLDLDAMVEDASMQIPGFQTHYISFPWAPDGPFTLWGKAEDAAWFRSQHGSQVSYSSKDLTYIGEQDIRQAGIWKQVVDAFEPLHFGDFGGLPVKIVYGLGGLAPGILACSGMLIWWKRRRK